MSAGVVHGGLVHSGVSSARLVSGMSFSIQATNWTRPVHTKTSLCSRCVTQLYVTRTDPNLSYI